MTDHQLELFTPPTPARRFAPGQQWTLDGLNIRIVAGDRTHHTNPDAADHVIEWETPDGWRRPSFQTIGLIIDFLYENEHTRYPPPNNRGGEMVFDYLQAACQHGWNDRHLMRQAEDSRYVAKGLI